jgi:hypothetical protein
MGADLVGRARRQDAAVDQHGDAVGQRKDRVHVVLDQQHGALALQAAQQLDHALALLDAHARHRLVEQQQAGIGRQRHGDLELALLAVAQGGGERTGAIAEAHRVEPLPRGTAQVLVAPCVGQEPEGVAVMRLDGERHIVEGGELAQHRGDLERPRETQPHPRMGRQARHVAAGETDRA